MLWSLDGRDWVMGYGVWRVIMGRVFAALVELPENFADGDGVANTRAKAHLGERWSI